MSEEDKVFRMVTNDGGKSWKEHPYVDSFEAHGEVWVIHRRLYGIGFGVSHKASGYGVPGVKAVRQEEARVRALAVLDANAEKLKKVIAEVMTWTAEKALKEAPEEHP